MLKTLESTEKRTWKNHISKHVNAYNCTQKTQVQDMHHTFFFWTKTTFANRLILSPTDDVIEDRSNSKFVEDWKTQMSEACQKALQNSGHKK